MKKYLEYRDDIPESILDYKELRKTIEEFKTDEAINILNRYYEQEWKYNHEGPAYSRFLPYLVHSSNQSESIYTGTHNIGLYSTALCLETIAAYASTVDKCKNTDEVKYVCDETRDRRVKAAAFKQENRKTVRETYGKEKAYRFFQFIIDGLSNKFGAELGFLAKIATLLKFGNYLNHYKIKNNFIKDARQDTRDAFNEICRDCLCEFMTRFASRKETIHLFELYRFLEFTSIWETEELLSNVVYGPQAAFLSGAASASLFSSSPLTNFTPVMTLPSSL